MEKITINKNIKEIGAAAFYCCFALKDIYYSGSEKEWKAMSVGEYNEESFENANIHFNSSGEENDEIENGTFIYTNNATLSYMSDANGTNGDDIFLYAVKKNNGKYTRPEKLAVAISDTSVVELKKFMSADSLSSTIMYKLLPEELKVGKIIAMKAKKPGFTVVTITNTETNETFTIPITVSTDDLKNLRVDKVGDYRYYYKGLVDDNYNAFHNGIYVADIEYEEAGRGWYFSMNIYNQNRSPAVLEVFNADGSLRSVEIIDKFEETGTSITETFKDGYHLIKDAKNALSFRSSASSQHTKIQKLYVPQDGIVRITADSSVSTMCFVVNLFDAMMTGKDLCKGLDIKEEQKKEIEKELVGRFVKNTFYLNYASKFQENMTEKVYKTFTEASLISAVGALSDEAKGLLEDIDIDFEDICKVAIGTGFGMAESMVDDLFGPAGEAMSVLFTAQKSKNYMQQLDSWIKTMGHGDPFGFVTPVANSGVRKVIGHDGVKVETNNNVKPGTYLQTFRVLKDNVKINTDDGSILNKYVSYDIALFNNGTEIQPTDPVTVHIPLPVDCIGIPVSIARQRTDGSWELIDCRVDDGVITFEVSHFCLFAVVPVLGVDDITIAEYLYLNYKDTGSVNPQIDVVRSDYTVEYTSSDLNVVNVDNNGKVKAVGRGESEITIKIEDEYGNVIEKSTLVEVNFAWWQWIIYIVLFGWIWY
ncbi:MAG: hypothetical protein IJ279_03025 [Clostridia bacterium]|nr:hypothetical protein [Clostridia bacterium]